MCNDFTSIIERGDEWYIGSCPEMPGANGQGRTVEECRASLEDAMSLILEDRSSRRVRSERSIGGIR